MDDFNMNAYLALFGKDEVLYEANDESGCMFIILEGRVGVYKTHELGETLTHQLIKGQFVGEVSYLAAIPRQDKVVAMEKTRTLKVDEVNLEQFITWRPQIILTLISDLSEQLRIADEAFVRTKTQVIDYSNKEAKVAPPNILEGKVFPTGHAEYPQIIDELHIQFLLDKSVTCPLCEEEFNTFQIRQSKLQVVETQKDYRRIYEGFDELWYNVWTCPHCYYSNFYYDFFKLRNYDHDNLKEVLLVVKSQFKNISVIKKTFDQVFESYYLALACKSGMKSSSFEKGRIWLYLAWLYKDCGHEEMYKMAYEQARNFYCDGWYSGGENMDITEEQKLCIMIAEMFLESKDMKSAKEYFFKAIINKGGKKQLNDLARGRLYDMKEAMKNEMLSEEW